MPIVVLYGISMVLVAALLVTQVIIPAADRRIPYFPNFRPRAWAAAKILLAEGEVKQREEELRAAKDEEALAAGTGWHMEQHASRKVRKAEIALREAQLFVNEVKKTNGGGTSA